MLTFRHCAQVLQSEAEPSEEPCLARSEDVLAEIVVVSSSLALLEEYGHALRHVDPKIPVEIRDDRCHSGQRDSLEDAVVGQMLATEGGDLKVVLDDEGTVETLKKAEAGVSSATHARVRRRQVMGRTPKIPIRMYIGISK